MEISLSNEQMRGADGYTIQTLGVPSLTLMERAGEGMANVVSSYLRAQGQKDVLVVCGGGNNGGDGFVVARKLKEWDYSAVVLCKAGKFSNDCLAVKEKYDGECISSLPEKHYPVIVDCIFGTGLSREVQGVEKELIDFINGQNAYVISADIPSGLNGDNGQVMGVCVKANQTVSVQAYKNGLLLSDGLDYCGKITVIDIGIDLSNYREEEAKLLTASDIAPLFAPRKRNTHKGSYGKTTLLAGSVQYSGAALLSAQAALRTGTGYTRLCVPKNLFSCLVGRVPELLLVQGVGDDVLAFSENILRGIEDSDCIAVGMGCGVGQELYKILYYLLKNYKGKLLIDADGLNALAKFGVQALKNSTAQVLLTPHVKEFSRLSGKSVKEVLSEPVLQAKRFASEYGVTVLLKSASSVITDGKEVYINVTGSPALAKGGSGDVLSGICASLLAQGKTTLQAAAGASYLMGFAAEECACEQGEYSPIASDVIARLGSSMLKIAKKAQTEGK